jgi:RNA polymerase sigma factor (sigma-70 family)
MHRNWVISPETFEALLDWLDADRDQAAIKYEQIRSKLINFFSSRAQTQAEELADETIDRVASRLDAIKDQVYGERVRYFYGVARMILMEYLRRKQPEATSGSATNSEQVEVEYRCLEECIAKLSPENRKLVLTYYQADGRQKIDQRKLLAEKLGIAPNALRIRAYRIRAELQKCVEECIERSNR